MPTSAACRAGRSLTPSPRNPVVCPEVRSAATIRALCPGVQRANTVARSAVRASSASVSASISSAATTCPGSSPRSRQARAAVPGWSPVSTFTVTPRRASTSSASAALGVSASRSATKPRKASPCSSAGVYVPSRAGRSVRATASSRSPSAASRAATPASRSRSAGSSSHRSRTASTAPLVTSTWVPSPPGSRTTAVDRRRTGSKGRAATASYEPTAVRGLPPPEPDSSCCSEASSTASSRASGAGRSASWSVHSALTAAQCST